MNLKNITLVSILIACTGFVSPEYNGVSFKSKEVGRLLRTGIDITKDGSIEYNNSFAINFELLMRAKPQRYGYICRLKEIEGENQFDLICDIADPKPSIFLIQNKSKQLVTINLAQSYRNNSNFWFNVRLTYNHSTNEIELAIDDVSSKAKVSLPKSSEYNLIFGLVDNYGFQTTQIPPMSVKDIEIYSNNKIQYNWPLNNSKGNSEKDILKRKKLHIINAEWEINHHSQWIKKPALDIISEYNPQIAYDSNKEVFYILTSHLKLFSYDIHTHILEPIEYFGLPIYEEGQQLIVNSDGNLIAYSLSNKGISVFDQKTRTWSQNKAFEFMIPRPWFHNKIFHPITERLTTLNGYGQYTYCNTIQSFNAQKNIWEELDFNGDVIYPRHHSSFGTGANTNKYYLFGGLGNKSGKQSYGTEFYYDLYTIDFSNQSIQKNWEISRSLFENNYTPANSLIVDDANEYFYTVLFSHDDYNTHMHLAKFSLTQPEFSWMIDSIPCNFNYNFSFFDVKYIRSTNLFLAIELNKLNDDKYRINFYTIKNPPVNNFSETKGLLSHIKYWGISALLALLVLAVYIIIRRRKRVQQPTQKTEQMPLTDAVDIYSYKPNSIYMFGGFRVFESSNKDITYRFSPTLKELFILLLLFTFEKERGISSKEIQVLMWPDKTDDKAKNNRGVNIKKLREILEDIEGIEIEFENNYWKIALGDHLFCDYIHIIKQIKTLKDFKNEIHDNLFEISNYLRRGIFLTNTSVEWLDSIKGSSSLLIVDFLESQVQLVFEQKKYSEVVIITDCIFSMDQLNEIALKNKIKALSALGNHSLSIEVYNNYCKAYFELYAEEYSTTYKSIAKKKLF